MKIILFLLVLLATSYDAFAENGAPSLDDMPPSMASDNYKKYGVLQEKGIVTEPSHKHDENKSDAKRELNKTVSGNKDNVTRNPEYAKEDNLQKKIDDAPLMKKADGVPNPPHYKMEKVEKENLTLEMKRNKIENPTSMDNSDGLGNFPHEKESG